MSDSATLPTGKLGGVWLKAGARAATAGLPSGNLWAWLKKQVDTALYRPQAAPGVVARRLHEDGVTYYVLKNPANAAYLKLSETDYVLWGWMDGTRSVKDLVVAYFERFKTLAFGRITSLVRELKEGGFLTDKPVRLFEQAETQLAQRDWGYRWRQVARAFVQHEFAIGGLDRWVSGLYRAGGWLLFTPVAQVLFIVLALVGLLAFLLVLTAQDYTILATGGSYWLGLILLWAANFGVIFIHEHAHALTTKHYGCEVRRGGFLIYYGMPAFFVDTMDIWMAPKRQRIAVTWAGPYSGLILGGVCGLGAYLLPAGLVGHVAFKTAFVCYVGVLVNLNPLLELDGYFILIDWLGMPNLRQRSFAFVRTELWPKLKKVYASVTPLPGAKREPPPAFDREEAIFTTFGLLAAGYTLYTVIVAGYFWQTRLSVLLRDLWQKPDWLSKFTALTVAISLLLLVVLVLGLTIWNAGRGLFKRLRKRRFFERDRSVAASLVGALVVVMLIPAFLRGRAWTAYAGLGPILLLGLAVAMWLRAVRQHRGARFQHTFWGLTLAAGLLLGGALVRAATIPDRVDQGGLVRGMLALEGLAGLPLLVAAYQSLLEVDLRHSPVKERVAVLLVLALSFVPIIPVVRWTMDQSPAFVVLAAAGPWFTMIFVAASLPTLATYRHTRFFFPWLALVVGAALNGGLGVVRLAPAWPLTQDLDLWLALLTAVLWAVSGVAYVSAGLRLYPEVAHWSEDLLLSESERLRVAFGRFFETLFGAFRSTHGARRAKAVDDDLDVIAVAADWDVEIDSGRVQDELDLGQITILEQADRYRDVLARAIDLMDDWAGSAFVVRATQAAYDSLPWPERETLGRYVLAGSPWGGAIAGQFDAVRSQRYRLLQQVPLLADCNNRALGLIMAAIKADTAPAGAVLGRQGEPVSRFVVVQSGALEKWVKADQAPKEQLVGVLRRGASFGSEAFMGGGRYSGTYRAAVATNILYLTLEECENLRRAGVKLASEVGQLLAIRRLLGQMPLFANLGPQQLDGLVRNMGYQQAREGEVIIRQGEERHHLYVIAGGEVEVSVQAPEEEAQQVVARLGPGQHFGETSLYEDVPYSATCRAVSPSVLLTLDEATFDAMVSSSVQMTHYVEQVSSGRTIDTRRKLGLGGVMS